MFDHIINWELRAGSHEFPGPHGGTCINEAAIVAAGFEYREVASWRDCPSCFCPTLAQFAIMVNDGSPDHIRKLLMPLVSSLAGSKDEEGWVERARAEFIEREVYQDVVTPFMRHRKLYVERAPELLPEIDRLTESLLRDRRDPIQIVDATGRLVYAIARTLQRGGPIYWIVPRRMPVTVNWSDSPEETFTADREMLDVDTAWAHASRALVRAFRIGTQAPAADTAKVVERMEVEKARALERA